MSAESDVLALLEADTGAGGVATLLTGGLYSYGETGRLGITRTGTPAAFSSGYLAPCAVVKSRGLRPDGGVQDDVNQDISVRETIEIWLYNDGDAGYSTLETVLARIYTVLHGKRAGGRLVRWQGDLLHNERDTALDNACMLRTDYMVWSMK